MKLLRRIVVVILSLILLLLITGWVYEHISRWQAHKRYDKGQTFVDVGGYKLHYTSTGTDTPTVVFESGLDIGGALAWYKVQPEVAKFASTFSYDRAGELLSERGNKPKTGYQIAVDLHTLLKKSGHNGPYILVGHSMAGILIPSFIKLYPNEVKGIVYVDCSHPLQIKRFAKYPELQFTAPPMWQAKLASELGLSRLFYKESYPSTGSMDSANVELTAFKSEAIPAALEELNAFSLISDSAAMSKGFGNIPLIVLTGTGKQRNDGSIDAKTYEGFMKIWMELQADHLKLSTNSKHVLATKSGHYIQLDEPHLVIDAIRGLTQSVFSQKKEMQTVFETSKTDDATAFKEKEIYRLKKHAVNADLNYSKLGDIDGNIKNTLHLEDIISIFEPVNGEYEVYQFIATFKGNAYNADGPRLIKDFHDILIIKTDKEHKILDAYQYTLEWAERPFEHDLFKSSAKNVQLINNLDIGKLQFKRSGSEGRDGDKLRDGGIIKLE